MPQVETFLGDGMKFILDSSVNTIVKLVNYSVSGGDYDDSIIQTVTGSTYVSGLIFPMRGKSGSTEAILIEQGKLLTKDKILYMYGNVNVHSSGLLIGIGSPSTDYYTIISNGIHTYSVNGSNVYHKLWLRHTIPGSLFI